MAINLMGQMDKCVSRTAWKCWVGFLSPFQPFLLINLDVNLIREDLIGIEPLQDSFSNYPGKADPTNRQQGYFQYV